MIYLNRLPIPHQCGSTRWICDRFTGGHTHMDGQVGAGATTNRSTRRAMIVNISSEPFDYCSIIKLLFKVWTIQTKYSWHNSIFYNVCFFVVCFCFLCFFAGLRKSDIIKCIYFYINQTKKSKINQLYFILQLFIHFKQYINMSDIYNHVTNNNKSIEDSIDIYLYL